MNSLQTNMPRWCHGAMHKRTQMNAYSIRSRRRSKRREEEKERGEREAFFFSFTRKWKVCECLYIFVYAGLFFNFEKDLLKRNVHF